MPQAVAQYPYYDRSRQEMYFLEMPVMEYEAVRQLQIELIKSRHNGQLDQDVLLMLEHKPVFTLGRRGGKENLKVSEDFIQKSGIQLVQIERGGSITYHGPGQLILYPVLDLRAARLSVSEYVEKLEEIMIRIAAEWCVASVRDERNRGVWVGNSKLGSVGIAVRHGIAFHGIAFNANISLEHFGWINPCGLQDVGVTSLERETGHKVSMQKVRCSARKHFQAVFGKRFIPAEPDGINKLIKE